MRNSAFLRRRKLLKMRKNRNKDIRKINKRMVIIYFVICQSYFNILVIFNYAIEYISNI